MKRLFVYTYLLLAPLAIQAQQKTKVLVLGTYHMGNPGLDAFIYLGYELCLTESW